MKKLLALAFVVTAFGADVQAQVNCPEFDPPIAVGTVAHASLTEISGIAASRLNPGVLWAHNDSGDSARLFAMNTAGSHMGMFYLDGATAVDWEDMAIGPGPVLGQDYLYVADMGNNDLNRSVVTIYRVPEPSLAGYTLPAQATLSGVVAFPVQYPNNVRHDAETLLVDPRTGDILLVTRDRAGTERTFVYLYPVAQQTPGVLGTLVLVAELPSSPIAIKGGDVSADGQWVILRRHSTTTTASGRLYYRAPGTVIESAFAGTPCLVNMAAEPQGEAVAFTAAGTGFFTVSEGAAQPIYYHSPLTPPTAPMNGSAIALSSTSVRLTWSDTANNEAGFVVERSTDGVNFASVATLTADSTTFTDTSLTPVTAYWYRVSAFNTAGVSAPLLLSVTTLPNPPAAPTGLSAIAVSKSQINLSWTDASANEDGFKIERSTDGRTFTQIGTTGANATVFKATGLAGNKLYYFRVRAFNAGGNSAYSNTASAQTPKR